MKKKFKIGQLVLVDLNKAASAGYTDNSHRKILTEEKWRGYKVYTRQLQLAKITGIKIFWEGEYCAGKEGGGSYFGDPYGYEPAYCTQDKMITLWCIRLGYKNKELHFFEEDITLHLTTTNNINTPTDIPYFWNGPITDEWRKKMSEEAMTWPRDEKGRFK